MESVKIFVGRGLHPDWLRLGKILENKGFTVCQTKEDADISIVLSGQGVNTLCLTGKKVLVYTAHEWVKNVPSPHGFNLYKPVMEEYYDDFLDITGMGMSEGAEKVVKYIGGLVEAD